MPSCDCCKKSYFVLLTLNDGRQALPGRKIQGIYGQLNEQQRLAVDRIEEGPVMVIAGPGTGKTQILSARIGRILLDTDTMPQNILCLYPYTGCRRCGHA